MWGRLCLPLGSSEPPLLTLHTHPLRLTPGLAHFGGWGSPCSVCICGRGGNLQPQPRRPNSVPGGGAPGGGCLPSWAAHELWVQQSLAGSCFQNLGFFPSSTSSCTTSPLLWYFRVCTAHLSGDLWAVSQHLCGSRGEPCSAAGLSPIPHFPFGGHAVLHCALFLIAGTGIEKLREPREMHGSLL